MKNSKYNIEEIKEKLERCKDMNLADETLDDVNKFYKDR